MDFLLFPLVYLTFGVSVVLSFGLTATIDKVGYEGPMAFVAAPVMAIAFAFYLLAIASFLGAVVETFKVVRIALFA